jgi:hypothetical protein
VEKPFEQGAMNDSPLTLDFFKRGCCELTLGMYCEEWEAENMADY